MAKSIHLPCKNKPLHTAECSECSQLEHRVENLEECCEDVNEALAGKQDVLESGENIKTINGESVLGSGNIEIQGGGGDTVSFTQTQQSGNELGTITINGTGTNIYSPTETDPTVPSWAKASTKPSYTASEVGAVPTSRTVNGKALSSNINLDASDVGAQPTLVSGTNIKTVNGNSLLGSGDITIQGGGSKNVWYGYTSTASSTGTKVVTTISGDFTLADGNFVSVVFSNKNTTAPLYLDIDGTGAVGVEYTDESEYLIPANTQVMFVYDDTDGVFYVQNRGMATATEYGLVTLPKVVNVSITVADWNATITCTKSVTGVTASNIITISPAPSSIADYVSAGVYCSAQANGTLTFECTSTPTADLVVNVKIEG